MAPHISFHQTLEVILVYFNGNQSAGILILGLLAFSTKHQSI